MRELTKIQNYFFAAGALLMVVGVGCMVFGINLKLTSVVFAVGSITFALLQMSQRYDGMDLTLRRLRTLMIIGDFCFIFSALLALEYAYQFVLPLFTSNLDSFTFYSQYIYNNWVIPLLIGSVFELYTTHRISYIMNKK